SKDLLGQCTAQPIIVDHAANTNSGRESRRLHLAGELIPQSNRKAISVQTWCSARAFALATDSLVDVARSSLECNHYTKPPPYTGVGFATVCLSSMPMEPLPHRQSIERALEQIRSIY